MFSVYLQMCSILLALNLATLDSYPNDRYFKPGDTIVLKCQTEIETTGMIWSYKKNRHATHETLTEDNHLNKEYKNKMEITGQKQFGQYYLRILNTTRTEEGIYTCTKPPSILQVGFRLLIEEPPRDIKIVNISKFGIINGIEGQVLSVTCQVIGGNSKGQIYWRNATDFTSESTEDISWPMSHINFVAKDEHDRMNLTCVASHEMLIEEIQTSVTFNIFYTPKIEIYRYPTGDIKEGQQMNLTCLDISNPPKTNMTWKKDGVILSSNSVYEKRNLKTNDSGNYSCIVSNSLGTELDNIFIFVNKSYDEHNNDADSSIQMEALLVVVIYICVCCCGTFLFCSLTRVYPKCRKVRKRTTVL